MCSSACEYRRQWSRATDSKHVSRPGSYTPLPKMGRHVVHRESGTGPKSEDSFVTNWSSQYPNGPHIQRRLMGRPHMVRVPRTGHFDNCKSSWTETNHITKMIGSSITASLGSIRLSEIAPPVVSSIHTAFAASLSRMRFSLIFHREHSWCHMVPVVQIGYVSCQFTSRLLSTRGFDWVN